MTIREAVDVSLKEFPIDMVMRCLRPLTEMDRFQASSGIEDAAAFVAAAAAAAGLSAVKVQNFLADGQRRHWTFQAPQSWAPVEARLSIVDSNSGKVTPVVAFPQMPCTIATYSAGTAGQEVVLPLKIFENSSAHENLAGSLVVIPAQVRFSAEIRVNLERSRAAGFVADAMGDARVTEYPDQTGRIELPSRTPLLGFSVDAHRLGLLLAAASAGHSARASITVYRDARMPIVTAELPGEAARGVLLIAHLCHVRPGANDNASGVAALLGIAKAIRGIMRRTALETLPRPVRFLWAPEFCGSAAYLHGAMSAGDPLPLCVLNLDMVGENQQLCGSTFIVERSPDHLPSFVNAVIEHCVDLVWARRERPPTGSSAEWRAVPFAGFSDHAVFADRSIAVPGIQLGHWPDRFNHSSADDLEKVDPEELRNVGAAATTAAWLIATAGPERAREFAHLAARWGMARISEIAQAGRNHRPGTRGSFDPFSPDEIENHLHHAEAMALAAIETTLCLGGATPHRAENWLRMQAGRAASPWVGTPKEDRRTPDPSPLQRLWPGPFNLRAALEDLATVPESACLTSVIESDKRIAGTLLALALAIDGRRSRAEVVRYAAFARHSAIRLDVADRFLDALAQTRWIESGGIITKI